MKKKLIAVAAAALMVVALAGCSSSSSSTSASSQTSTSTSASASASGTYTGLGDGSTLNFITGGESGTYYAVGGVIAQDVSNNQNIKVTSLAGAGSKGNVIALEDKEAQLGFCQSDVLSYAYEGTNLFDTAVKDFSIVAALYDETVQIVTCDPDIKTVADLKGKNVSIGAAGSGVYFNAIDVLGAYGLTESDINPT